MDGFKNWATLLDEYYLPERGLPEGKNATNWLRTTLTALKAKWQKEERENIAGEIPTRLTGDNKEYCNGHNDCRDAVLDVLARRNLTNQDK